MLSFLRRHLDPVDMLAEILFGLIMALGFTGAVRLGLEAADSRALFISILGCNFAWAIVDGVVYALSQLFERGRQARVARDVLDAPDEEEALRRIAEELEGPLIDLTAPEERRQLYLWVVERVRRSHARPARLRREDLFGALGVASIIVLATLPMLLPFLLVEPAGVAIRVSNAIGLTELWLLGMLWARWVGQSPWRVAGGLTAVGVALVGVTIALGG